MKKRKITKHDKLLIIRISGDMLKKLKRKSLEKDASINYLVNEKIDEIIKEK